MDDERDETVDGQTAGDRTADETTPVPARVYSPDDEAAAAPDEAATEPEADTAQADQPSGDEPSDQRASAAEPSGDRLSDDETSGDEASGDRTVDDEAWDDGLSDHADDVAPSADGSTGTEPGRDSRDDDGAGTEAAPADDRHVELPTAGAPAASHAPAAPTASDAPADSTAAAGPAQNGWLVLARALRPRSTKAQVLAGLLCALLGFALVVQVRQNNGTNLEGMRQADLVRMLDETTDRSDALQRQASDLQAEHDQLVSGSDRRQAALDALERTATTQGILTGRLPAQGPGIVLTLSEPTGSIRPLTMLDVLEEMRNSGAEAIELNGHRITASSAFTGQPGAVVLDGATLEAPYRWTAIGDPDTMATALQIPGGALAAVRNDGGQGTVERNDLVKVTAIRAVPDPVYATPVPAATP